ncbi:22768_t:CDS:2 [Dentiscutata erythropus]|uniref:22768_t:CDS:1 n=1 Tax=Dentiscutata erythropus TaxID=1348616 RepID=A0A9N9BQZ7_9GLOM|nr:22768_t:CDS:2 [Dentiscutata erythropus]
MKIHKEPLQNDDSFPSNEYFDMEENDELVFDALASLPPEGRNEAISLYKSNGNEKIEYASESQINNKHANSQAGVYKAQNDNR